MAAAVFISFRLKVMDAVSFEAEKRLAELSKRGFETHRIAGMIPGAGENDHIIAELNHTDPEVELFTSMLLDGRHSREELLRRLDELSGRIAERLFPLLDELEPKILFCENIFSRADNIPLTVALCRYIEDRALKSVAIHHQLDFGGSRCRESALSDIIESHLPASMPQIAHFTRKESQRDDLYRITGLAADRWRHCHDFDSQPTIPARHRDLLKKLGIEDERLILQPSLVVDESSYLSVGFAESYSHAGDQLLQLLVTGKCRDGFEHEFSRLRESSALKIIHLHEDDIDGTAAVEVLSAAYACSDVLICPGGETIGDAVMEAAVLKKPLVMGDDLMMDSMRDQGIQFLPLDGGAGMRAYRLMSHPELLDELTMRNYEVGRRCYSVQLFSEQMEKLLKKAAVAATD